MKYIKHTLSILACLLAGTLIQAQTIDKAFKEQTITQLAELIEAFYVSPEVATATSSHLLTQWKSGNFDSVHELQAFADTVTATVQEINHDKHMRVLLLPPYEAPANSQERLIEENLNRLTRNRETNAGFYGAKILEGNVGYLDIRFFAGMQTGKEMADAYMKLLANADAVIIDLTQNTGGSPPMVQYLCSYFFDQHLLLNTLYFRRGDELHEFWTLDQVGGKKLADVPLFVLTSKQTFSGAEEFSYNMQTQKRATLVGQITGGGANPGQSMNLNDQLRVIMPMGKAINPVTNTNWEGTGVHPDVETTPDQTFDKAFTLAAIAAEQYRAQQMERYKAMYTDLFQSFEQYDPIMSEENIIQQIKTCHAADLLQEWDINMMGYEYLTEKQQPQIARCIFKTNTLLFPESPNAFDSYAESLMANGDYRGAVENYAEAVDLAQQLGYGDLELYQNNLNAAQVKLKEASKE